jgi:hypothetical protein
VNGDLGDDSFVTPTLTGQQRLEPAGVFIPTTREYGSGICTERNSPCARSTKTQVLGTT